MPPLTDAATSRENGRNGGRPPKVAIAGSLAIVVLLTIIAAL